ncbi:MAG TPA: phosphoadenosine phosphosulfate reductase [Propionibacteriaceae bacterium]|nr:phosphoadenosine phosphosulfate reductase [Propionibacteriaceae bacterium]
MHKAARHVLGLSGGKDSAALAIYMRDRVPEMEYVFCDTQKELQETYDYLDRLETVLGKGITRLNAARGFDHWLELYGGYLPSSRMRWCTRMLKIKPFEEFVGDDLVFSYVGIRADEDRGGYVSSKPNITPVFPFKDDGIREADVFRILQEAGVGLPRYYEWRTRSGCYFCFFQRKAEWVGLLERHPDLFEKAKAYEKLDPKTGVRYTWSQSESLEELERPERVAEIKENHARALGKRPARLSGQKLVQVFAEALNDDDDTEPCLICNL